MKTLAPVSAIAELQILIENLNREIALHQDELGEFESNLKMVQSHPSWRPKEDSNIFETLEQLVSNKSTEIERKETLDNCRGAIAAQQKLIAEKQSKVKTLEVQLQAEKEETEWIERYAPHVSKYESAFPTPNDPRLAKIASLEKDIRELQPRLDEATRWANAPDLNKPRSVYCRDPKNDFQMLPSAIATREQMIEKIKAEPAPLRDEVAFRMFIKQRVELEQTLQALLKAQETYFTALEQFKSCAMDKQSAVNFSLHELTTPKRVSLVEGKIVLS